MHKPMSPRVHFHRSCCAAEDSDAGITASAAGSSPAVHDRSLNREIFASALGAAHRHSTALHWEFIFLWKLPAIGAAMGARTFRAKIRTRDIAHNLVS